EADARVAALFQRKFGHPPPDYPHHVGAFWRDGDALHLAHYLHFLESGDLWLLGGACTDGSLIRSMPKPHRDAIAAAGGLMLQAARHGLAKFGPRTEAIYAHCGDARSFAVLMQAGFQPEDDPYLLAYRPRLLRDARRRDLFEYAKSLGAF